MSQDLQKLAQDTQAVYERNAKAFDQYRSRDLHERRWLDRFLNGLPCPSHLLDLGCGTGEPIAQYLTTAGHKVTGVDASSAMIALARDRTPAGDWRVMDMRQLSLARTFDGIIGWNSFFHLTRDEQRQVLPKLVAHLRPGGRLMLTVGYGDGEVTGHVGDAAVYHASLAPDSYRAILAALDCNVMRLVLEDAKCNGHSVLLAERHS